MNLFWIWYLIGLPVAWFFQKYFTTRDGKIIFAKSVKNDWEDGIAGVILILISWMTFFIALCMMIRVFFQYLGRIKILGSKPPKWL